MKITKLDKYGNVVTEKDYGNLAPKCYLEFNPSQPIFSVEEDELNIILTKSVFIVVHYNRFALIVYFADKITSRAPMVAWKDHKCWFLFLLSPKRNAAAQKCRKDKC